MSRGYGIPIPPVLHERYNFVLILFLPTPVIKGQRRHLEAAWATGGQWLSWRSVPSLSARGGKNPSRWTCWDTIRSPKASSNTPFLVRGEELRSACLPTRVSWERASAPCAGPCGLMPGEDSHVERPDLAWPSGENACHPCQRSASGLRFSVLVPRGELPRSNGITLVPLNIRDFRF